MIMMVVMMTTMMIIMMMKVASTAAFSPCAWRPDVKKARAVGNTLDVIFQSHVNHAEILSKEIFL